MVGSYETITPPLQYSIIPAFALPLAAGL